MGHPPALAFCQASDINAAERTIDCATAMLACAALLVILKFSVEQVHQLCLVSLSCFLLWPVSAVLTFCGKGTGKRLLLVAHGLVALLWTASVLLNWVTLRQAVLLARIYLGGVSAKDLGTLTKVTRPTVLLLNLKAGGPL